MIDQRIMELNATMAHFRGGRALLWEYAASLSELSIRLTLPGTAENTHLVCNGCVRMEATTTWSNVDFECERSEAGEIRLTDKAAQFFLLCAQVRVLRNVEPIFLA